MMVRLRIGIFREIFFFSLNFRPVSTTSWKSAITFWTYLLISYSLPSGIIRKWIESLNKLLSFLMTCFIFWYMYSVRNGTKGLIKTLIFSRTSNKTWRLFYISEREVYPLMRLMFNLTYQLLRLSKRLIILGITADSLYYFIYFLTLMITSCKQPSIHLSVMSRLSESLLASKIKRLLVLVSSCEMRWIRKR